MNVNRTVWPSVDECVRELRADLPLYEEMLALASLLGESRIKADGMWAHYQKMKMAVDLLKNESQFRKIIEKAARPDGSVQFSFSPEAWKLVSEKLKE